MKVERASSMANLNHMQYPLKVNNKVIIDQFRNCQFRLCPSQSILNTNTFLNPLMK